MSIGGGGGGKVGETADERALAERGVGEWNDYVSRYVPQEDKLIQLSEFNRNDVHRLQGESSAQAAIGLKGATRDATQNELMAGAGAGSGRAMLATDDMNVARVSGAGLGGAYAEKDVMDRSTDAKMKLTSFGRGLASDAQLNLTRSGSNATSMAIAKAQNQQAKQFAAQNAVGTAVGLAGSYGLRRTEQYLDKNKDATRKEALKHGFSFWK